MKSSTLRALGTTVAAASVVGVVACGNDNVTNTNYGSPPDANTFDPGQGGNAPYGGDGGDATVGEVPEAAPPTCPDSERLCAETFTYPYNGETSVELRGNYAQGAWTMGAMMMHVGSVWTVTVPVPWGQPVEYKFYVNGSMWETNPTQPTAMDDAGDTNNVAVAITCPSDFTCSTPPVPPAGVFDWRDAVIYWVFVDRFFDGDPSNNCNVAGTSPAQYTSTNYLGGDWAGVTQKISAGYFADLGVNTLWITVPVQNADTVVGAGVLCNNGSCSADSYEYSAYHGYWPSDPTSVEKCFGTPSDLQTLVTTAHANKLKVLFDYAMVDIHTSSSVYINNPSWFTPFCQCGDTNDGCSNYDDYKCWFAPYLAHFDFTNSSAARSYSVNAALGLLQQYGNDAFRLDAIKQVDPSWLTALRPLTTTYENQVADGGSPQRFYMVGETYDFDDMAYIRSFIDDTIPATTGLDGQFDFPLRYRIVQAVLLRDSSPMLAPAIPDGQPWVYNQPGGMQGLAAFMDFNDTFYPETAVMSTFIGNHDLPRSIHYGEQTLPAWLGANVDDALTANGSDNAWVNEPAPETDQAVFDRLANAFAVILTNKGAPLIYYGDEIGQPGAGDPDNRRMMPWSGYSAPQQSLYARVKALTAIRAAHPAMRRGTRMTLDVTADLWVYQLTTQPGDPTPDTIYVAINRSDNDLTTTALPAGLTEQLTMTPEGASPVTIPARQTRIFK
jgi:glycosidase